jgi:hypothetical protein
MLDRLSRLFLLTEAFGRIETLPPATQADVRTLVGIPTREEEVLAGEAVRDTWCVVGQKVEEEDRLRTQRTILWGKETNKSALVLVFAYAGQPLKSTLIAGTQFEAELAFYPSAHPLRAAIKQRHSETAPLKETLGHPTVRAAVETYCAAVACQPWIERYPMALQNVALVRERNRSLLRDEAGDAIPLAPRYAFTWELLAISGGAPVSVFGEFDGQTMLPMGVVAEGAFHGLV